LLKSPKLTGDNNKNILVLLKKVELEC